MPLQLPPLPDINPGDTVFSKPSWVDSMYLTLISEMVQSDYTFAVGTPVQIVNANPNRWAIGFQQQLTVPGSVTISPSNDPDIFGEQITTSLRNSWYTIFTHGNIVPLEWYAAGTIGLRLRVYEIILSV